MVSRYRKCFKIIFDAQRKKKLNINDLCLLLNESQNSDKVDFRNLKELLVSMCTMTSSTLNVGTLLAFGSYIGFAKLNKFSSLNIFPVLRLVSANGSG